MISPMFWQLVSCRLANLPLHRPQTPSEGDCTVCIRVVLSIYLWCLGLLIFTEKKQKQKVSVQAELSVF